MCFNKQESKPLADEVTPPLHLLVTIATVERLINLLVIT